MVQNLQKWVKPFVSSVHISRQNGKYLPGEELKWFTDAGTGLFWPTRVGKFIVFQMITGDLVCHNAMSGYWDTEDSPWTFDYVEGKRTATDKDVRVKIGLADKLGIKTVLRFHDTRLFGSLRYYKYGPAIPPLSNLGPDALLSWTPEQLIASCKNSKKTIKEVLMDQHEVAGIGNIYASEGLFRANLRPDRTANRLTEFRIETVHRCCVKVLEKAIATRLDYPSYLSVYRKNFCPDCHSAIAKMQIAGRSTYFCPNCQV